MKNLLFEVLSRNYSGNDWCLKGEEVSEGLWDSNFIWSDLNQTQKPSWEEIKVEIENFKSLKKFELLREKRNQLLEQTDWWVLPDRTPTQSQLDYRQALRDITKHSNWPNLKVPDMDGSGDDDWPVKPS